VRRLVDPFNFSAGVVGPIIAKGIEIIGRVIRVSSNYLILSFNLKFIASRFPIELSKAYPVAR
jgi:hypothetical protein